MHRNFIPFLFLALTPQLSFAADVISIDSALLTVAEQADIAARDLGTLSELRVREGQRVNAGDILAQLDDEEEKLACARCKVELDRVRKVASNDIKVRLARKELEIARAELKRATDSSDRFNKSVTVAELDRLKLDVDRAVLQVEQAEFDLDTARDAIRVQENELSLATERLRRRQLVVPIAGTVVSIQKHLGESVEAGQVVARVIATKHLRAEFFMNVDQVPGELTGSKVQLTVRSVGLDAQRFPGVIVFVNPEVDPVNGQVRVWAEIDNPENRLRPGLAGSIKIGLAK